MKNGYFIVVILVMIIYIFNSVLKSSMSVKESFFWLIGSILALCLAIFPKSIDFIAAFLGVSYPPTILLVVCIIFLLFMNFRDSKRIASQHEKIIELAEQIAIINNLIKKQEEKKKRS